MTEQLEEKERYFRDVLNDCADVVIQRILLGKSTQALALYMEPTAGDLQTLNRMMLTFAFADEKMIKEHLAGEILLKEEKDVLASFFAGDIVLLVDGMKEAVKVPAKGYPNLGVTKADAEKGLRGSEESFADSVKTNATLLRKRLKSPKLKAKEYHVGTRSDTLLYLMYVEDLIFPNLLSRIEEKIAAYHFDGLTDSGVEGQLLEEKPGSVFLQIQSTKRPALACEALLSGRAVLLVDNSPEALLLPTAYQNFFQVADDQYLPYLVVASLRSLRYFASVLAMFLPGIYVVAASYEHELIPANLFLTIQRATTQTPFGATSELILMESAFLLLQEAGVRMPGEMGNAIGIVGGLIIGSAAIQAGLISPMTVMVVAFTALCNFSVPSEEMAQTYRLLNIFCLVVCSILGAPGLWAVGIGIVLHLASLSSLGYPFFKKVDETYVRPAPKRIFRGWYARRQNPVRLRRRREKE